MKWSSRSRLLRRGLEACALAIVSALLLQVVGVWAGNDDERYIKKHYALYRLNRFLLQTERDAPLVHRAVALACGDRWNRRFCVAAAKERQDYERRMEKRRFKMECRSARTDAFKAAWEGLGMPAYARFSTFGHEMNLEVVVLARDLPAVETMVAQYDQPQEPSR